MIEPQFFALPKIFVRSPRRDNLSEIINFFFVFVSTIKRVRELQIRKLLGRVFVEIFQVLRHKCFREGNSARAITLRARSTGM